MMQPGSTASVHSDGQSKESPLSPLPNVTLGRHSNTAAASKRAFRSRRHNTCADGRYDRYLWFCTSRYNCQQPKLFNLIHLTALCHADHQVQSVTIAVNKLRLKVFSVTSLKLLRPLPLPLLLHLPLPQPLPLKFLLHPTAFPFALQEPGQAAIAYRVLLNRRLLFSFLSILFPQDNTLADCLQVPAWANTTAVGRGGIGQAVSTP